jgi:hypothetical protein
VDDYVVPVQLNQTLRPYQQEGINWLAFLRRFHLHGVLCDDMVRHTNRLSQWALTQAAGTLLGFIPKPA